MRVVIREHDVSSTVLEVVLTGIAKDSIKISEFKEKYRPRLLTISGITSVELENSYGNSNEILSIKVESGVSRREIGSKLSSVLQDILDVQVQTEYRESDPIDYL